MCRIKRGFRLAFEQAEKSEDDHWRLGAVIMRGGSVLSAGYNRQKNEAKIIPDEIYFKSSIHAEAAALAQCSDPEGADLFVARITPGLKTPAMARPCDFCQQGVLSTAGFRRVYYVIDAMNYGVIDWSKHLEGTRDSEEIRPT